MGTLLIPQFYTKPLAQDFSSAGPKLRAVFEALWRDPQTGKLLKLDEWQAWLIDRLLETYPPNHALAGQLRYRQVVVLIPRQNGKSLIAACLTFYFMFMHVAQANVVGTAGRNKQQAKIVYRRLRDAILASPQLRKEFGRAPGLDHMTTRSGSTYTIYPSSSDALQGEPITGGICDELHLMKKDVWDAVVVGQRAQAKTLLIGLSTAGNQNSDLLASLITSGKELSEEPNPESRFGFFMWQAPSNLKWDSPEAVLSCNPAVAAGRMPIEVIMDELNKEGASVEAYKRYTLNWTASSTDGWMDMIKWIEARRKWPSLPVKPTTAVMEFAPGNSYATIALAGTDENAKTHTYIFRSYRDPSNSEVAADLTMLRKAYPEIVIGLDSWDGKDIAERLRQVGIEPRLISLGTYANAAVWSLSAVVKGKLTHDGNGTLHIQASKAQQKFLSRGGYRLSPTGGQDIDALKAVVEAAYLAHIIKDELKPQPQIYFGTSWS